MLGLREVKAQRPELRLGVSPGQRLFAFECPCVTILADQRQHLRAACADAEPEGDARRFAGCDFHAVTQREHRIKDRTRRVGQRPGIDDRHRVSHLVPASQKARSIGLELQASDGFALQSADESDPEFRFAGISGPSGSEQRTALGNEFRLHE